MKILEEILDLTDAHLHDAPLHDICDIESCPSYCLVSLYKHLYCQFDDNDNILEWLPLILFCV